MGIVEREVPGSSGEVSLEERLRAQERELV